MRKMQRVGVVTLALACFTVLSVLAADDKPTQQQQREAAQKASAAGNYKDAYDAIRKIALDDKADARKVGGDLELGLDCLRKLGRVDEIDEFRESVIAAHGNNWRLLQTAGLSYADSRYYEQHGFIVAGKFYRGNKRGGKGRYVSSLQRDRS